MQLIERPATANVVVDYAHTPQALSAALQSLRSHLADSDEISGQLICVFGCGGDRDKGKRALMGAAAEKYADKVFITNDNPRTESPVAIAADILEGIEQREHVELELDRAQAIRMALDLACENDVVLIAGKGHEDYQVIGSEYFEFSDVAEVERYAQDTSGVQA
jgi:UDP-N-acetylmuramoyl-L-alanyl-D-glutamate--2,6-diaminopimelate ligase